MKLRMYCIFAKESVLKMNGNRGKLAAMSGHAFLHSYWDSMKIGPAGDRMKFVSQAQEYKNSDHAYKIVLIVDTIAELEVIQEKYKDVCGVSLVKDAGFTVFNEPTVVCLGLGPISEENIGDDLKELKLFL